MITAIADQTTYAFTTALPPRTAGVVMVYVEALVIIIFGSAMWISTLSTLS